MTCRLQNVKQCRHKNSPLYHIHSPHVSIFATCLLITCFNIILLRAHITPSHALKLRLRKTKTRYSCRIPRICLCFKAKHTDMLNKSTGYKLRFKANFRSGSNTRKLTFRKVADICYPSHSLTHTDLNMTASPWATEPVVPHTLLVSR
jgi:hypothetical protein